MALAAGGGVLGAPGAAGGHHLDAVHRTGVNCFLDQLGGIAILAERPGAAPVGLNHEGVGGHMGAVAAANTDSLINPDGLLAQAPAQEGLHASAQGTGGRDCRLEGQRRICHGGGVHS